MVAATEAAASGARIARPEHRSPSAGGLALGRGHTVARVAEPQYAARSAVSWWARWFRVGAIEARSEERRRGAQRSLTEPVLTELALGALLKTAPQTLGCLHSRWSSGPLARELRARMQVPIQASTVRRALGELDWWWRRVRPILLSADRRKKQRMRAVQRALKHHERGVEVFYQDETDFEVNPSIGPAWPRRGKRHPVVVPTPGKNRKACVAGALDARAGKVLWVGGPHQDSDLFIVNLAALEQANPLAKHLVLILDNHGVHKSRAVSAGLAEHPKSKLLFHPPTTHA